MDRCTLCWQTEVCESCKEHRAKYGFKQITNIKTGINETEFQKLLDKIMKQMSLREQESFLVNELSQLYKKEEKLKKLLAKVRGGKPVKIHAEERGDIQYDVKENNA